MFVYVTLPDLMLRAALDAGGEKWSDRTAAALDPGDRRQGSSGRRISHVNRAALLEGVRPGMTVSLAVDLCPGLRLLRPDPVGAERAWEESLRRIESIGAGVEPLAIGSACFDPTGLSPLYGGIREILERLFGVLGDDCRVGVGPTRLAASIALASSAREVEVVPEEGLAERLGTLPLGCLRGRLGVGRGEEDAMLSSLKWLGIERLGELGRLGRGPMTDRFGEAGTRAWELASGIEEPILPRKPRQEVRVTVEIPDDGFSVGLSPALAILCTRLSARLGRVGRAIRSTRLEARLQDGGSWHCERSPKVPTSNPDLIRILFEPALGRMPGIPVELGLVATVLAEAEPSRPTLFEGAGEIRLRRLDEAVRQVRAAVGDAGLLKVVETNPRSRLPERRVMLVPCEGAGRAAKR